MQSGSILDAVQCYRFQCVDQPLNWWPFYRAAWCYNLLDNPDSAFVYAETASRLYPSGERCLSELLKALAGRPEQVLEYADLVSGGGACRYRLAKAEMNLNIDEKTSLLWFTDHYASEIDSVSADAGCWLSILHGDQGLEYIRHSVLLMPDEVFYRSLLIEKFIDASMVDSAALHFQILKQTAEPGLSFWQTASSVHQAMGDTVGSIEASRRAWEVRKIPATAADLGWKLYFYGRNFMRNGSMIQAEPLLRESSNLWSGDSLWALKSDSLIDLMNEFTSTSDGYGEPI